MSIYKKLFGLFVVFFSHFVFATPFSVTPGFSDGSEHSTLDFMRFQVTQTANQKFVSALSLTGPEGEVSPVNVQWDSACAAGYTMNASGLCTKDLTESVIYQCEPGYRLENQQCVKDTYSDPVKTCPEGTNSKKKLVFSEEQQTFIFVFDGCEQTLYDDPIPVCPSDATLNPSTGQCEKFHRMNNLNPGGSTWASPPGLFKPGLYFYRLSTDEFLGSFEESRFTIPDGPFGNFTFLDDSTVPRSAGYKMSTALLSGCPAGYSLSFKKWCDLIGGEPWQRIAPPGGWGTCEPGYEQALFLVHEAMRTSEVMWAYTPFCVNFSDPFWAPLSAVTTANAKSFSPNYCAHDPNYYPVIRHMNYMCEGMTIVEPQSYNCSSPDFSYDSALKQCKKLEPVPPLLSCDAPYTLDAFGQCVVTEFLESTLTCPPSYTLNADLLQCNQTVVEAPLLNPYFDLSVSSLFPGEHALALTVTDDQGDTDSVSITFYYVPRGFTLDTGGSGLRIPAVAHAFRHLDGSKPLKTGTLQVNGQPLVGVQPVYAALPSSAPASLNIEGNTIAPGSSVLIANLDFTALNSQLSLGVYPMAEMAADYSLLLTIGSGTDAVAAQIDISAWEYDAIQILDNESPVTLFETYELRIGEANTDCQFTTNALEARSSDIFDATMCLVEWSNLPDSATLSADGQTLTGAPSTTDPETISYSVSLVDSAGVKHPIYQSDVAITPKDPYGIVSLSATPSPENIVRGLQDFDVTLIHDSDSHNCTLTTDPIPLEFQASERMICYVKFTLLPADMVEVQGRVSVTGTVSSVDDNIIAWEIYAQASSGASILLNNQQIEVGLVDPEPPTISLSAGQQTEDGRRLVNVTDQLLGTASVRADPVAVRLEVLVDGTSVYNEVELPTTTFSFSKSIPIYLPDIAVGIQQSVDIVASYELMPDLKTTVSAIAIGSPDSYLSLDFTDQTRTDTSEVFAGDNLALGLTMEHLLNENFQFDPAIHGDWQAELVKRISFNTYEPVTSTTSFDESGIANINYPLSGFDYDQSIVLYGRARFEQADLGFESTLVTQRGLYVKVLYADPVTGALASSRLTGKAPMSTSIYLRTKSWAQSRSIGSVKFYQRVKGDTNWTLIDTNGSPYLYAKFEEGHYEVKAVTENKHDPSATFETEPLEIVSYSLPDVEVLGDRMQFIGEAINLTAKLSTDGQELNPNDYDIAWVDARTGEQVGAGPSIVLSSDDPIWQILKVKVTSQAHRDSGLDIYAYSNVSIAFKLPRGPRIMLAGDRVIDEDVDRVHVYEAITSSPYSQIDLPISGHFLLPNGEKIPGNTWEYDTSTGTLGSGYHNIWYEAWMEGYEEYVTRYRFIVRVQKYEFPSFALSAGFSVPIVPFERSYYLRAYGVPGASVQNFDVQWDLPPGASVVDETQNYTKRIRFDEPGPQTVGVRVVDHLGNESIQTDTIEATVPEPYVLDTLITPTSRFSTHARDPYSVAVRTTVSGGHPLDYPSNYVHRVNGDVVSETGSSIYNYMVFGQGSYRIDATVTTRLGKILTNSVDLAVAANQPPTCDQPSISASSTSWKVFFQCSDPDGRVLTYHVAMNGSELYQQTSLSYVLLYNKGVPYELTYYVKDDSGEDSQVYTVTLTP